MARERSTPYAQFRFNVQIQDGPDAGDFKAGFQEVSGLGIEISVAEYRAGNSKNSAPMKITTTSKANDVTLKRGVLGELETLYNWLHAVRQGSQQDKRDVTVQLLSEDGEGTPVQEWKLTGARPIKYTGPTLTGTGTDVAVEELTLACERVELA